MKKSDVINHFGNMAKAMRAIGISRSAAVKWGDIVPSQHAINFVIASNGEIPIGIEDYQLKSDQDQQAA